MSHTELSNILYRLIYFECGGNAPVVDLKPYNELRPILNENYTLTLIKNLETRTYEPSEIASILVHVYQYSIVSNNVHVASMQTQPYVTLNMATNGQYIFSYETFNDYDNAARIRHMNDIKYITNPIDYLEKPCFIDTEENDLFIDDLEKLYSPEKCDQYLANLMMLKDIATSTTDAVNNSRSVSNTLGAISKKSRDIRTLPYILGYYYYGLGMKDNNYVFTEQ